MAFGSATQAVSQSSVTNTEQNSPADTEWFKAELRTLRKDSLVETRFSPEEQDRFLSNIQALLDNAQAKEPTAETVQTISSMRKASSWFRAAIDPYRRDRSGAPGRDVDRRVDRHCWSLRHPGMAHALWFKRHSDASTYRVNRTTPLAPHGRPPNSERGSGGYEGGAKTGRSGGARLRNTSRPGGARGIGGLMLALGGSLRRCRKGFRKASTPSRTHPGERQKTRVATFRQERTMFVQDLCPS